ncbi:Asp23/Gls24 family envelope stress response protein [Streptomyces sp. NPDC047085]|uniref:Asp23/Gls24 family envelope stress response protein n=1 Tax=Streptomyces sp. NPDC047085 TaxID=3155140 RepID=UPI0033E84E59
MSARPGSATPLGAGSGPPAPVVGLPPPAERGATIIPDKVVARIAAEAARKAQLRCAAIPPDRSGPAALSASAATHTGSVRLHLTLDLPYPTDLPRVSERIQRDVADRVARLTGLNVREVTLTIRRLVTLAGTNRGRVQ